MGGAVHCTSLSSLFFTRSLALGLTVVLAGCRSEAPPPLAARAPDPLPRLERAAVAFTDGGGESGEDPAAREALHHVSPAPAMGSTLPEGVYRLELDEQGVRDALGRRYHLEDSKERAAMGQQLWADKVVAVGFDEDVFVAQAAPLLSLLDDAGGQLWFVHPDLPGQGVPVSLKDESEFGTWLDAPTPGRIRVIQRADGFELQTAVGKLPGGDPNGPSIPNRGGQPDLGALREALGLLAQRFRTSDDVCFVPSYGTSLKKVVLALGANFYRPGTAYFDHACVVYPRPGGM